MNLKANGTQVSIHAVVRGPVVVNFQILLFYEVYRKDCARNSRGKVHSGCEQQLEGLLSTTLPSPDSGV